MVWNLNGGFSITRMHWSGKLLVRRSTGQAMDWPSMNHHSRTMVFMFAQRNTGMTVPITTWHGRYQLMSKVLKIVMNIMLIIPILCWLPYICWPSNGNGILTNSRKCNSNRVLKNSLGQLNWSSFIVPGCDLSMCFDKMRSIYVTITGLLNTAI